MTHIMLDLETWGKTPVSDIRSIGAVVFDPVAGYVAIPSGDENNDSKSFYFATENPNIDDLFEPVNEYDQRYRKYPLTRDPETIQWWNDQSPEAQAAFANPVDLWETCRLFGKWLRSISPISDYYDVSEHDRKFPDDIKLWANDPHFDVSILDAVFRAVRLPVPWHYRAPRSMKTICDLANITREDMAQFNHGTIHNALDDAISQAMIVCEGYKRLGLQKIIIDDHHKPCDK